MMFTTPEQFRLQWNTSRTTRRLAWCMAILDFIDENDNIIGKFKAAQTDLTKLRRGYVHIPQPAAFFRAELLA